jgi:hypothetical protein
MEYKPNEPKIKKNNLKQQWFFAQYGRNKESYDVLLWHPVPHSINRFLSYFDDAVTIAGEQTIEEINSSLPVSDFQLVDKALQVLERFEYKEVVPALVITLHDLRLTQDVQNGLFVNLEINSNDISNNLILVQYFDGINYDTIQTQLFETKKTEVESMKNRILSNVQELNKGFELGEEKPPASNLSLNDEFTAFLLSQDCISLKLCDVFIHCNHGLLSHHFYGVLGEELYQRLSATNTTGTINTTGNLESNSFEEEDLPF